MPELKPVTAAGWLLDVNDNFDDLAPLIGGDADGLGVLRVARFTFDSAGTDSADADNSAIGAHGTGVFLPIHAINVGGFVDVNTALTSENTNNATVAVSVQAANDIISATAVSGSPYSTIGRKAITPKANTPESTSIKTTAAREITVTVATSALTAGKFTGYLYYVEGVASA